MASAGDAAIKKPERKILSPMDMPKWLKSQAYDTYIGFLTRMNEKVKRRSSKQDHLALSPVTKELIYILDTLDNFVNDFPPQEQPQRFGNKAFRDWHSKMSNETDHLLTSLLGSAESSLEVAPYLKDSFGNATRIDYGTGHEANFLIFLCCLYGLDVLKEDDSVAVVLHVFDRYLKLMRNLQRTYKMEPAGSHGVWSLDDFHFVPFIWGSAQLIDHPILAPSSIVQENLLKQHAEESLFLGAVQHINQVKMGPFAEHSNQLWNISGVGSWSKVNQGLIKMYKAEVLGKFPVVQHFVFGSLLSFEPKK